MMANRNAVAVADLRHSLSLNSNDAMTLSVLAYGESKLGDIDGVKANAFKAIRLNPKDVWTGTAYLAPAQTAFDEDDEAFRNWAEEAIRAQPNAPLCRARIVAMPVRQAMSHSPACTASISIGSRQPSLPA